MLIEEEKNQRFGEKENQPALFNTTLLKYNLHATEYNHYKCTVE